MKLRVRCPTVPHFLAVWSAVLLVGGCASGPPPPSSIDSFMTHCSSCHGPQGEGDGPVAAAMSVTMPNLRNLSQRNGGEFPADEVASYIDGRNLPTAHGERYMPVWGEVFDATARIVAGAEPASSRIDDILEYLRRIQY
jgi:mono/diheme cytochrome c family protein